MTDHEVLTDLGMSSPASLEQQLDRFALDVGELYRRQKERAEQLEQNLVQMRTTFLETVRSMAYVVEAKDAYTGQHLERCRVYGNTLMQAIGVASEYPDAEYGFLLHDVGKVGVPERILNKPGPLSAPNGGDAHASDHRLPDPAGHPVHDDGRVDRALPSRDVGRRGYPEGLKGEQIPLPARVFQVVDAFDAMTTDRPYRASLGVEKAAEEIQRMAGSQFDPDVCRIFDGLVDQLPQRL